MAKTRTPTLEHRYGSSDIMFFPSSVETFGNVTLEAMACALPVVVDKYCSGHLVEDGTSGFGVESLDENAYYDALCALTTSRKLRERFGRAGLRKSMTFGQNHCDVMLQNYISEIQNRKLSKRNTSQQKSRGFCLYAFDLYVFVCTVLFFSLWGFVHSLIIHIFSAARGPVQRYNIRKLRKKESNEMKGSE